MKIDLRDKLKTSKEMRKLPANHRIEFEQLLHKELHQKPLNQYRLLKIAASILLLFSLGYWLYQDNGTVVNHEVVQVKDKSTNEINSLADISPELKKIEEFYVARINYKISNIRISDENKELLEIYFSQLSVLQREYDGLKEQLVIDKVNVEVINAIIENLQLRLQLLQELKKKLDKIDNLISQQNENEQI